MSARDSFFKKVQENQKTQQSQAKKVTDDIKLFRFGMAELTGQIKGWLTDSGVQVTITERQILDRSLKNIISENPSINDIYPLTEISLVNGTKAAKFTPDGLYFSENGSSVLLTVNNTQLSPAPKKFVLVLDNNAKAWTIRPDEHEAFEAALLTEETFFRAIETLA